MDGDDEMKNTFAKELKFMYFEKATKFLPYF